MSDIKKWGSGEGEKSASPDLYKALEEMCDMWEAVCEAQTWEPEHMPQYTNAMDSLAKSRGECHE